MRRVFFTPFFGASALGGFAGGNFGVEFSRLLSRNGERSPFAGLRGEVPGEEGDLPDVVAVMRDLAVDGLRDGVRLGANRDCARQVGLGDSFEGIEQDFQPRSQSAISSARVLGASSNSVSRLRSGFSPSVTRKSVQRERMLPAMCFTMMAMEFDSASSTLKRPSSGHCSIARSASFL